MKWVLFDNVHRVTDEGVKDCALCVNLDNVTDFKYEDSTLKIGYIDGTQDEYECDMATFVTICSLLEVVKEIE